MSTLTALQWRHSLKHFSEKEVPNTLVHNLVEAARLSASSYGLQPFQVIVVHNKALQQTLSTQAYGQPQVSECSHLIILANKTEIDEQLVEQYFERLYHQTNQAVGSLDGYSDHIKSAISAKSSAERLTWAQQQAYIALGSLLSEAAMLGIDACPMTGFDQAGFNRTLGLSDQQLNACVICAVGYRRDQDIMPTKVRTPMEEFAQYIVPKLSESQNY